MFQSKSQIENGNFECIDLGGKAYLWTPPGRHPKRLIITAHGIRATGSKFILNYDGVLNFYSDDKNSVEDPGLKKFYLGNATPKESIIRGRSCYNYSLSKYTNSALNSSHNKNNETYDSINDMVKHDYASEGAKALADLAKLGAEIPDGTKTMWIKQAMDTLSIEPSCILTIRNRMPHGGVNLKWVIDTLQANGYQFDIIDCLFCRNTVMSSLISMLPVGGDYSDAVPVT